MKVVDMSVALVDYMGGDLSVVNAARVSYHKNSEYETNAVGDMFLSERDTKLLQYLARHNHWTPFGHVAFTFRIKAPLFVARQLGKHQVGLVWNEVSRRYVDEEPEFFFPKEWRGRPINSKQGSSGVMEEPPYEGAIMPCEVALEGYQLLIAEGVAPEQARMVLPQNTMTEWIWTGSLVAFARVCKLRLDPHTQLETQEVAKMISDMIAGYVPVSWDALMNPL